VGDVSATTVPGVAAEALGQIAAVGAQQLSGTTKRHLETTATFLRSPRIGFPTVLLGLKDIATLEDGTVITSSQETTSQFEHGARGR
jgi:hypothetical protein